ncbi:MAG: hypothetical protein Q9212_004611 [Teloschistes hypoglaucus]
MPPATKRRRLNQASKARSHNRKCPLLNILDYDSQYPVCDRICSFLPIGDLVNLTRTCRQLSSLYQNLLPAQWNVDRRLLGFVNDPKALRSFMGKHDVLISGSFAIQFFERVTWKESDLDLYAEAGPSTEALDKYLCEKEGYRISRRTGGVDYWPIDDWVETRTYTKKRADSTDSQIQIVATAYVPIFAILMGFYSTLVVNVISWNKAYAIYPQSSFIHHKSYLLKKMDDYNGRSVAKYDARGWRSQDVLWPEEEASHGCIVKPRRLNDKFTWTIPFDVIDVAPAATPDFVLEFSTWKLAKCREVDRRNISSKLLFYITYTDKFWALILKHRYIFQDRCISCSSGGNEGYFWEDFLQPRLIRMSLMELHKVPAAKRSQLIEDTMKSDPESLYSLWAELERCGISLPKYDHEIPGWYAEWEKTQRAPARIKAS